MYAIFHLQTTGGTWYWSVHFSRSGKYHARTFPELKYGGSDKALKAATAWRDEQLAKVPALTVAEFCQHKRSNNTSGVPGVHFLRPPVQPEGIWQAKLTLDGGRYTSKTFSVAKFGYQKAYELAVAARAEMLISAKDKPYLYHPIAKRLAPTTKK